MAVYEVNARTVGIAVGRLKVSRAVIVRMYENNIFADPNIKDIMLGYGNGQYEYAQAKQKLENLIA